MHNNVISFQKHVKKNQNPIKKMCETFSGRNELLGFMEGVLCVQNEYSDKNDTVQRLFEQLNDRNKQVVLDYAIGEVQKQQAK